jgi:proteasome lid subunit RPN8/RPN11
VEKDFDIEITIEENSESGDVQLPLNFLSFGEIEPDDVKVYIKQDVYKALEKYASSDTSKELGTILIGDYCEELGKTHAVISDYIEAKYTDASASTLTFTHETWDYVHKQHDKKYPNKKIIGWQHTHPNYGIFLSNYDLFIQDNFFNMPFQVAYVIDPIQNLRGFFQWKNGKTEKLKGYYIYDDVGTPIKIEQKKLKDENNKKDVSGKKNVALISVLCLLVLALGVFSINLKGKYNKQLIVQENMTSQLEEQAKTIDSLETQLVDAALDPSGITTANELIKRIENKEIALENQDEILKQLKDLVGLNTDDAKVVHLVAYTVKSGDTLTTICDEHKIDYQANKNIILALNGISNPNEIGVEQIIILPVQ